MAACTSGLRRTESRAGVTGFATDIDVRAVEHEAGAEVIKGFFITECKARQTRNEQD